MWLLAEDTIGEDELDDLADWLRTHPRLTQGQQVSDFEAAWSRWLGVEHSIMVTSGTTANLAIMLGIIERSQSKPRVGVAAVTWSTNVTPAMLLGCDVVVFDVSPSTLGVDEEQVCTAMLQDRIDVLFVTHLLGFNGLSDRILQTASETGVTILEDCCEAHGARHNTAKVGTLGLASSFSFYFGHHMSTVEGGMVSTDDDDFADRLRLIRSHGLARASEHFDAYKAASPEIDPRFLFVSAGLNLRSTELNAFLGLSQLKKLDKRIGIRNKNLAAYLAAAPPGLWSNFDVRGVSSFALPIIAHNRDGARAARDVVEKLGIESRPVVAGNLMRQPFIANAAVQRYGATPVADRVHDSGVYVGNGHHITPAMVGELTDALAAEPLLQSMRMD